jgi:hypothetical protein
MYTAMYFWPQPHLELSGQIHAPRVTWGKGSWYPLDKGLAGPQNRSGRHEEEENLAPTETQLRAPGRLPRNQSPYRLRHPSLIFAVVLIINSNEIFTQLFDYFVS